MIHEKTTRKRQENRSMKIENRTPHQDGFYMPGEFEPQDGVILIWPKRPGSWPYEANADRTGNGSSGKRVIV